MKDTKISCLVPDLSRYIKTATSGTLYLPTRAHWRLNKYAEPDVPEFKDRSGNNLSLYTVSGSIGSGGKYTPVLSSFDSPSAASGLNSPFGSYVGPALGGDQGKKMAFASQHGEPRRVYETVNVGNGQRARVPYVNRCINFEKLGGDRRQFLATERHMASNAGPFCLDHNDSTYMLRFQYRRAPTTSNAIFTIGSNTFTSLAVETIANSYNLKITFQCKDSGNNLMSITKTIDMDTYLTVVNSYSRYNRQGWFALFFTTKQVADGSSTHNLSNIRCYFASEKGRDQPLMAGCGQRVDTGPTNPVSFNAPADTVDQVTNPTLVFGYGDPSPNVAFDPSDFQKDINILEFCVFDSSVGPDIQQSIVESSRCPTSLFLGYTLGPPYVTDTTQYEGFSFEYFGTEHRNINWNTAIGGYRSGLNNIPVRRTQAVYDARRTLPDVKTPGDPGRRVGSGSIVPFDDTNSIMFVTQSVLYPEMIPTAWVSGSANMTRGPVLATTPSPTEGSYQDVYKTPLAQRITASQVLHSGIQDESYTLRKWLGQSVQQGGFKSGSPSERKIRSITNTTMDSAFGGIMEPFNDDAPPHDAYYLNKSGTLDTVMPGFDSKLGDKVAIVIPLNVSEETTAGTIRSNDYYGNSNILTGSGAWLDGDRLTPTGSAYPIMYYNPSKGRWEPPAYSTGSVPWTSYTNNGKETDANGWTEALHAVPQGFQGTTGFTIYPSSSDPLSHLPSRGGFTDFFGFPYDDKYRPLDDKCHIDMSQYISDPFVLEATLFEVNGEVIDAGPDCLGLRGGDLRAMPYTGSNTNKNGFLGAPTTWVVQNQDGDGSATGETANGRGFNYARGGVIGGGDLVGAAANFDRYVWGWINSGNGTLTSSNIPHGGTAASYVTGSRFFTGNQSLIPAGTSGGVTMVTLNGLGATAAGGWPDISEQQWTTQGTNAPDGPINPSGEVIRAHASPYNTARKTSAVTSSAAPFWRCDTFFILRERKEIIEPKLTRAMAKPGFTTYSPYSFDGRATDYVIPPPGWYLTSSNSDYVQTSTKLSGDYYGGNSVASGFQISTPTSAIQASMDFNLIDNSFPFHINFSKALKVASYATLENAYSASHGSSREIVTYSQMVHYGYVSASLHSQMMIDGWSHGQTFNKGTSAGGVYQSQATNMPSIIAAGETANLNLSSAMMLGYPRLISSPTEIAKNKTVGSTEVSFISSGIFSGAFGWHPHNHWDYSLYGSFETTSHTGFFPRPGIPQKELIGRDWPKLPLGLSQVKVRSKNWLDVGLKRDLNINISSLNPIDGIEIGGLVPVTGSLTNYQFAGANYADASKPGQLVIPQQVAPYNTRNVSLSKGTYRLFSKCRTPVQDLGSGVAHVEYKVHYNSMEINPSSYFGSSWSMQSATGRGIGQYELSSARSIVGGVPGSEPTIGAQRGEKYTIVTAPGYSIGAGTTIKPISSQYASSNNNNIYNALQSTVEAPVTTVKKYSRPSPYLLLPEDRIIVGFQCAMAGGNPANPVPVNTAPTPFHPGSKEGRIGRTSGPGGSANPATTGVTLWPGGTKFDMRADTPFTTAWKSRNQSRLDYFDHRFVFKTGPSRLVLYGSLVKDSKEKMPSLNQPLVSDSIRQALSEGPVVDQFNIAETQALSGSYIHNIIEGAPSLLPYNYVANVAHPAGGWRWDNEVGQSVESWSIAGYSGRKEPRGRKRTNIGMSGSYAQRFVTLIDPSELWYDSCIPNIRKIWEADGAGMFKSKLMNVDQNTHQVGQPVSLVAAGRFGATGDKWGLSDQNPMIAQLQQLAAANSTTNNFSGPNANASRTNVTSQIEGHDPVLNTIRNTGGSNHAWKSAFPFEQRYAGIERLVANDNGLGITTGSYTKEIAPPMTVEYHPATGIKGAPLMPLSASGTDERQGESQSRVNPIMFVSTVQTLGGQGGTLQQQFAADSNGNVVASVRAAKAFLFGYGRLNRKHLDLIKTDFGYPTQAMLNNGVGTGGAVPGSAWFRWGHFDHPAGVKYGMSNYDKQRSKAVFRSDSYGQFRDMLEPRLYTRFFEEGDEDNAQGLQEAAISTIFVDADGAPVGDSATTTCFNLSQAATSSKPYIEGDTHSRTIIFTNRFVAVDWSAADIGRFGGVGSGFTVI